jgi:hypothetical protein
VTQTQYIMTRMMLGLRLNEAAASATGSNLNDSLNFNPTSS